MRQMNPDEATAWVAEVRQAFAEGVTVRCPVCGTEVVAHDPKKIYCSPKCNQKAYLQRATDAYRAQKAAQASAE